MMSVRKISHPNDLLNCRTGENLEKEVTEQSKEANRNEEFERHCEQEKNIYFSEANKLENELKNLGISFNDLDEETKTALDALADVAITLDLKEPTFVNYHLGLNHFVRENMKMSMEKRISSNERSKCTKTLGELLEKANYFERELAAAKKKNETLIKEGDHRKTQTHFCDSKLKEYVRRAQHLESELATSGINPNLYHSQLVKAHEEVQSLEAKLKALTSVLEGYHNLPPNEMLAELKVEEMKAEYARLQGIMQQKIEEKTNKEDIFLLQFQT